MATQICRHIRTNGSRCGCIALTGQTFCYYHARTGKLHRSINPPSDGIETIIHPIEIQEQMQRNPAIAEYYRPKTGPLVLDFPPLEDRESIQIALSMIVTAMAQNRIDPKRAGLMFYGLQVASSNARDLRLQPSRSSIVTQTVLDEDGQQIAPDEDPESERVAQQLLELIEQEEAEEAAELAEEREEEEEEERQDKERKVRLAAEREQSLHSRAESRPQSQSQPGSGSTLPIPRSCFAPNPAPDPTLVESQA